MISCIRQIGYYLCNPYILLRYWTSIKVEIKEIKDISWYIFISITVVVNYEKLESWLQMLSFILSRGAKRGIIKYVSHYRVLSREGRIIQNMQVLHTHSAHICCVVESYCKWPMGSCEGPQEAINKSELVEKKWKVWPVSYKMGEFVSPSPTAFLFWHFGTYHVTMTVKHLLLRVFKRGISKLVFWLDLDLTWRYYFLSFLR